VETSNQGDQGRDDDEGGAAGDKLIPEWGATADDQIIWAGLAIVGIMAVLLGWNAWRGGDGDDLGVTEALSPAVADVAEDAAGIAPIGDGDDDSGQEATATTEAPAETTTTEAAAETTTTESTTTTEAAPVIGDVQAAVTPLAGNITGRADGTIAVLDGFVANAAESTEAEEAAAAVEGITGVENNLVVLEPSVAAALEDAGVTAATAVGVGTSMTVSGSLDSEDARQPALDAAAGVEGVTDVVDRLTVSVTADLNELPKVQFATASDEILSQSFADLDAAAALINDAGDVQIEVQGYTDIQGPADANLNLSQRRAESVRAYLVDAGVDPAVLTAQGYGETEQFGDDLESNRLVRFQQTG
jgi:outer membrane protein OmpA-like peptidoglycan-associated protein